MILYKNF